MDMAWEAADYISLRRPYVIAVMIKAAEDGAEPSHHGGHGKKTEIAQPQAKDDR